jgi:hypothetical protein
MLITTAISFAASVSNFARVAGVLRDFGDPGLSLDEPHGTPWGWSHVVAVKPGSAADRAQIQPGDRIFIGAKGSVGGFGIIVGKHPVDIVRKGMHLRTTIVVPAIPPDNVLAPFLVFSAFSGLFTTILGLVLLLRSGRRRAAVELGIVLVALGVNGARTAPWLPAAILPFAGIVRLLDAGLVSYFLVAFCLEVSGGARNRQQERAILVAAFCYAAFHVAGVFIGSIPAPVPLFGSVETFIAVTVPINHLIGYWVIARNYRANDGPTRNRLKIIVLAFIAYTLSVIIGIYIPPLLGQLPTWFWILPVASGAMSFIAPALLTYAVLKQRLFNLNFALNRTLVYGVVSFILLAAFGLAEWTAEHLVPTAWHNGGALFSAAIALTLFLSFHRLRDWVERHVEKLLFSSWHRNEDTLRRFVAAVGHFEKAPPLCRDFVAEVSRFAKGSRVALYLREGDMFKRKAGGMDGARPTLPADDRALALMRAERQPLKLNEAHSSLPGALGLPMLDQGTLAGFVLLAQKGDRTDYRPDEIEVLGWATEQVGFALQAQHLHELQGTISRLNLELAEVRQERDRFRAQVAETGVRLVG